MALLNPGQCSSPKCQKSGEFEWAESEFPSFQELYEEAYEEMPFSEAEEMELAAELLSISSEEELDLFLGKLAKKAWRGIKKAGKSVARIAKPLGGVLKGIAKTALPVVGGALGSFIPVPGVGTALGSALGGALGKALEMEVAGISQDEQEFEMARRFVRLAGAAAKQAALAPSYGEPGKMVEKAVINAARRQFPNLPAIGNTNAASATSREKRTNGRWERRGRTIVLSGV